MTTNLRTLHQLDPDKLQALIDWLDGLGPKPVDVLATLPDDLREELEKAAAELLDP